MTNVTHADQPLTRGEARQLADLFLTYLDFLAGIGVKPDEHTLNTTKRRITELLTGRVDNSRQAPVRAD